MAFRMEVTGDGAYEIGEKDSKFQITYKYIDYPGLLLKYSNANGNFRFQNYYIFMCTNDSDV